MDDTKIEDFSISEVSSLLKGTPDSEVSVVVERAGTEQSFVFNRANIKAKKPSPFTACDPMELVICIWTFQASAASEVRDALLELKKENPKGIIFDQREWRRIVDGCWKL